MAVGTWSATFLATTAAYQLIPANGDFLVRVTLPLIVLVGLPTALTLLVLWARAGAKDPSDLRLDLPEIDAADTGDPIRIPAEQEAGATARRGR